MTPTAGERRKGKDLGFMGLKASRRFIWRVCSCCHEGRWIRLESYRDICHRCAFKEVASRSPAQQGQQWGEENPYWKGGKISHKGYREVRLPPNSPFHPMVKQNGYVAEHRLIMAKKLGRCLNPSEGVHHIDGNKLNNNEMNLELVTGGDGHP